LCLIVYWKSENLASTVFEKITKDENKRKTKKNKEKMSIDKC